MSNTMSDITRRLLEKVSDFTGNFTGAFNIRENGKCVGRKSSKNIIIEPKKDKPGIDITILPGTKGETVFIPACVTHGGVNDLVHNDFHVGRDCDVKIIAGCGVNTDNESTARHNGVHSFFLAENAHIVYEEKHMGIGTGNGNKSINPVTEAVLEAGSSLEIHSTQISGVDSAYRRTHATVAEGARLIVDERLFTECEQTTDTHFKVELNGEDSVADIVSRSVARDKSCQTMDSVIVGNAACKGHSECDAIIDGDAIVDASPRLFARHKDSSLIHEAAIGKIAGEQILKLRTFGLTEEEAEKEIIEGFLS